MSLAIDYTRPFLSRHVLCRSGEGEWGLRGLGRRREIGGPTAELQDFDVLVIWRTQWNETLARAVEFRRASGKTVVFDCDDLLTEPNSAKTSIIDGIRSSNQTEADMQGQFTRLRQTMLAADFCFATTEELAFHMRCAGKPTFVLPNGFNQHVHDLSRRSRRNWRAEQDGLIRIGYLGGSRTHQRDFGIAVEAIARKVLFRASGMPACASPYA